MGFWSRGEFGSRGFMGGMDYIVNWWVYSAVFLVLFLVVEVKFAVEPVMPLSMLKRVRSLLQCLL